MRPAAGRSKWGQDPDTGRWFVVADRWHTGIVDAAGTGGLLGHIDGRTAAKVAEWIAEQPDSWRAGITHVTIDLSASYLRAVTDALPHAVVVADRFHLVRLANDMVTEVRQRATREVRGRRGRRSSLSVGLLPVPSAGQCAHGDSRGRSHARVPASSPPPFGPRSAGCRAGGIRCREASGQAR
jgi:hypothetical protein